ncbi:MAG: cation transporter [Firmicutes bacterium]|nr:cation transporter [Bacillota bacterium]
MTEWLLRRFVKDYDRLEDAEVRTAYGSLAGWVGIASNLLLVAAKLLIGFLSGSLAIIADGLNNLSDAASSIVSLLGFKIAAREADREHPFGHGRYEYISGSVVAVMVFLIGIELGKSSIKKIIRPTPIAFGAWSFIVLIGSVLLKLWQAAFNRNLGRRINSTALLATSVDSRNDAFATMAVLIAMVVSHYFAVNLDGWMGLAVAGFILYSGVGLVKETLNPLVGEAPPVELADYILNKIATYDGVLGVHDLIVHDYGPNRRFASAHVEMSSELEPIVAHNIIDAIQRNFLEKDNIHLIIHHDPIVADEETYRIRDWVEQQVKTIDERLTIHDLRLIEGRNHINYIFDVVVPPEFAMSEKELRKRIEQVIQQGRHSIHVIVNIDSTYVTTST